MAETHARKDRGTGPGADEAVADPRPAALPWRLSGAAGELREEAGDLAAHLWRNRLLILGLAGAALAGAILFAWSGLYSVAATSGHYPFFRTFLSFALERSVATHTIGTRVPDGLDDPALIRRGAGHYQGGCAPCHGAPGRARNPITRRMLPEPPYLAPVIANWTPAELFWIVKHGIKYAGMPAWVAPQREDEVWAVVAFLLRLPALDPGAYRALAFGEAAAATAGAREGLELLLLNGPTGNGIAACARCHGLDGDGGPTAAFPRLQGQTEAYLYHALQAYALGTRPSGIMQPVAAELDEAEMRSLAAHYADQPATAPAAAAADPAVLALGRRIATEGVPERGVAACIACHGGPGGGPANPLYPRLAGQRAGYIATQLELWLSGVRGGERQGPLGRIMAYAVAAYGGEAPRPEAIWALDAAEIRAVAAWYAAQDGRGE